MAKKKKSTDVNVITHDIMQAVTEEPAGTTSVKKETTKTSEKNPAAVALGRLGGLKGGKARAAKLTQKKRSDIARVAAQKRWMKK